MKTRTILLGVMLLSLFCAIAVPARAQTANNNFRQAVTAYHMDATAEKVILMAAAIYQMQEIPPPPPPPPTPIPEEARRHFVRGTALFKDAKSPDDYKLVVDEFTQAANLAPWWPEARYNCALAWEAAGDYDKAIENLKLYLQFKLPDADARAAQDKIYALEAKQEKQDLGPKLVKALHKNNYKDIDVQEVLALINAGADVNTIITNEGRKPVLSWATLLQLTDIVHAMLDKGADVNATDSEGKTALMTACLGSNPVDLVRLLIGRGANVNAVGYYGKTVLMYCSCGNTWGKYPSNQEVERILINAGANVNARDNTGQTALNYVEGSECNYPEMAQILREAGAK